MSRLTDGRARPRVWSVRPSSGARSFLYHGEGALPAITLMREDIERVRAGASPAIVVRVNRTIVYPETSSQLTLD